MDLFNTIAAAELRLCLCLFFLRSQFSLQMPVLWKRILVFGIAGVILGAADAVFGDFIINAVVMVLITAVLCQYLGHASVSGTVWFSLAIGGLQLAAYGFTRLLIYTLPAIAVAGILIESILLYALTSVCAAFGQKWHNRTEPLLWLIPMWLVVIVLCAEVVRTQGASLASKLFSGLWLAYMGIRLWDVGNRADARARQRMVQQQNAYHYAQQEEYFLQLQEKQTQTRALWHDLNKYLNAAKVEYETVPALKRLESALSDATQITDVGNRVLNVILNEYAQAAKAAMIELRLRVQVPPELSIEVADLYVLIGNTMDNAIEACKAMAPDQRLIELTLRKHHDVLYYRVVNPYDPRRRRQDNPMRGYGLANVRLCVQNYHGDVEIMKEKGFFVFSAHLNLE